MNAALEAVFVPSTLAGVVALASVHWHLWMARHEVADLARRVVRLERGHAGDAAAHAALKEGWLR